LKKKKQNSKRKGNQKLLIVLKCEKSE
jgi:hypothetical protein